MRRKLCSPAREIAAIALVAALTASFSPRVADADEAAGGASAPAPAIFPDLEAVRSQWEAEGWLLHGQATFIQEAHPAFHAPYRGGASMNSSAEGRNTFSADLIMGRKLWRGAELIFDPQVSRGFGLSTTTGIAAFPSGEAFRLGSEDPKIYVAHAILRQTIALSGETVEGDRSDPLRLDEPLPKERITLTGGTMSLYDIFDGNTYAHDPRTQFMNWAFVSASAFDFAADARGYTNGAAAEYDDGAWGLRAGGYQVARTVNGLELDPDAAHAWQMLGEADRFYRLAGRPGAARLLYGAERTRSQGYDALVANGFANFDRNPNGWRMKHMVVINAEQELADDLGAFARASWGDGRSQSWMFTEQDRAVSAGVSLKGARWDRGEDTVGLAANVGWISAPHRRFLEAGGIGFIAGDGALAYAPEVATEIYYDLGLAPGFHAAADYQFVLNPAYNSDRGPVHVFGIRLHARF